jgi:hypothetical protein
MYLPLLQDLGCNELGVVDYGLDVGRILFIDNNI